jgi:hypothetical protein
VPIGTEVTSDIASQLLRALSAEVPVQRVFRFVAEFALALSLAGCVIPISLRAGTEDIPCHGLKNEVPEFIRVGESTREEVQQQLGKPKGIAPDGAWVTYGCTVSEGGGGVAAFYPPNFFAYSEKEHVLFRRLVVRFNANAVVSSADLEQKSCVMKSSTDRKTAPCLELDGTDLIELRSLPFLAGQGKYDVYEPVDWYPDWERHHGPNWQLGVLILTERSLMVRSGCDSQLPAPCDLRKTAKEIVNLPYSEISSVAFKQNFFTDAAVIVVRKQGQLQGFRVFLHRQTAVASVDKTKAALKTLQERLAAASVRLAD